MKRTDTIGITAGTVVGEIEVVEPIEKTESYECAAWHRTHNSDVGTFDLRIDYDADWRPRLVATLPATVTSSNFTSQFGGVAYGSKIDEDKGERTEIRHAVGIEEVVTNHLVRLLLEPASAVLTWLASDLMRQIKHESDWIAMHADSLDRPTDWHDATTGANKDGAYDRYQAGSVAIRAQCIARAAEVLDKVIHARATDRPASLSDSIEWWKDEYARRPSRWAANREFSTRDLSRTRS